MASDSTPCFSAHIITLFPELFPGTLGASMIGRGLKDQLWSLETTNLRDFGQGKHSQVDDTLYGGGAGLLIKPDVMSDAIEHVQESAPDTRIIYMSPRGKPLTQPLAKELSEESHLTLICGRYEGLDERVIEHYAVEEISIGDYVISGGEVAAMALLEACVRLIPGIMGEIASSHEESFGLDSNYTGLLEYPQYTKPPSWKGLAVPEMLKTGHHGRIEAWRLQQAKEITKSRRPDLWKIYQRQKAKDKAE